MTDLQEEWRAFVGFKLEPHSSALTSVLHRLVTESYPKEVVSLDFELFPDSFTQNFPAHVYFMDATNSEFFIEENGQYRYPSTVDPGLLDIDCVYSLEEEGAFIARDDGSDFEDEIWGLAESAFFVWFESCWREAGGEQFDRQATIQCHDSPMSRQILPTTLLLPINKSWHGRDQQGCDGR